MQNVEPCRRREWERYWFEFVVLMPVGSGDLFCMGGHVRNEFEGSLRVSIALLQCSQHMVLQRDRILCHNVAIRN